jgi:endonuclease/exonuclease/phosphatase family metal-dependent hydrolase
MAQPQGRVRVISLNLWGASAPLERRLDAVARAFAVLQPDVVLLQEVRVAEDLVNTAATLTSRMFNWAPWSFVYACATRGPAGTWGPQTAAGEEGLAILTRHPVAEHAHVELPEARTVERRILLSARIELPEGSLWCHTTHLHWRLGDGLARERQVLAIDEAIRGREVEGVQVLGGDFNSVPDSDEVRFLTGKHTLDGRRACWQDSYGRAHPGDHGWTWARRNPNTEALAWLDRDRRIDYLFVSPEKRDGRGRLLDSRIVLDGPEGGVWPSDHFGLLADIAV